MKILTFSSSRSSKVIDLGVNRKSPDLIWYHSYPVSGRNSL